jgi:hypothetical protein
MNPPFLVQMSDETFDAIPNKAVPRTVKLADPSLTGPKALLWIFAGYCERLLGKNEPWREWFQECGGSVDSPEHRNVLTEGQRILYLLSSLDGQVENGGVCQFFWNCPRLVFGVPDALESIGEHSLRQQYNKALEALIGGTDDWIELRKRASDDPANFWTPFQESCDLLDLGWFDDAYFQTYRQGLISRLVDHVRTHRHEFIRP